MDDDHPTSAQAPDTTGQYLPHDLVSQILLYLPVKSLQRFACVSKAWHDTITDDRCFRREHHRLQELCVLIAPRIRSGSDDRRSDPLRTPQPPAYTDGTGRASRRRRPSSKPWALSLRSKRGDTVWPTATASCLCRRTVARCACSTRPLGASSPCRRQRDPLVSRLVGLTFSKGRSASATTLTPTPTRSSASFTALWTS